MHKWISEDFQSGFLTPDSKKLHHIFSLGQKHVFSWKKCAVCLDNISDLCVMGKTLRVCFGMCVFVWFLFLNMATEPESVAPLWIRPGKISSWQYRQLLPRLLWLENIYNPHYLVRVTMMDTTNTVPAFSFSVLYKMLKQTRVKSAWQSFFDWFMSSLHSAYNAKL